MNILVQQSAAALSHEEVRTAAQPEVSIPPFGVAAESRTGCWMQGHEARFAELALSDCEHAFLEIDIGTLKPDRLGQTHARHCDQAEQIMISPAPQSVCRRQGKCRLQ